MRRFFVMLLGGTFAGAAVAQPLLPPVRMEADGKPIRVEAPGYCAPCWGDIDGDGKKDLLVGQFEGGKIKVYRNLGAGKLAAGQWLMVDGRPAEVPGIWCCTASTPQLVDLDGAGRLDLLSGSYSRLEEDMAGLFQVLRRKPDGTFRKAEVLNGSDGKPLIVPVGKDRMWEKTSTRPFVVDWDRDGTPDLLTGNSAGTFHWFKGEGKGKFSPKSQVIEYGNGMPLRIGPDSEPFAVDWDGDGDLDLVSGTGAGDVLWAKNIAPKGMPPRMSNLAQIIASGKPNDLDAPFREADVKGACYSARIWIDDVNGDGKLDVIVGSKAFLRVPQPGITDAEFKKRHAGWRKACDEAGKKQDAIDAGKDKSGYDKARKEYLATYESRDQFMKQDAVGSVWLYLRK